MEGLEKILKQIKEDNIVCPKPSCWITFHERIGGLEEKGDDYDRDRHWPLVFNGWFASKERKHERFVDSVDYFYRKYPNKRNFIESFFKNNNDWYRWDDSR